jgi:hypothetical protein
LGGKKKEKPRKKKKMLMLAQLNKGSRNSVRANLCQLSEERRKKRGASISACPSSIYCEEEEEEADDVICYVPGSSIYSTGKERERERERRSQQPLAGIVCEYIGFFMGPCLSCLPMSNQKNLIRFKCYSTAPSGPENRIERCTHSHHHHGTAHTKHERRRS